MPGFICQQLFDEAERALKHLSNSNFRILYACFIDFVIPDFEALLVFIMTTSTGTPLQLQLLSFQDISGVEKYMKRSIASAELLENTTPALPCASQRDSSNVVFERFQWQRLQRFVASIID